MPRRPPLAAFAAVMAAAFLPHVARGLDYAYTTSEPQKTGWPLSSEEESYVLRPEHERRPGAEVAPGKMFTPRTTSMSSVRPRMPPSSQTHGQAPAATSSAAGHRGRTRSPALLQWSDYTRLWRDAAPPRRTTRSGRRPCTFEE